MVGRRDPGQAAHTSHLFMLRLWPEDLGAGQVEWRGSVQHVSSGETRYFRDWPRLEAFVEGLLHTFDAEGPQAEEGRRTGEAP